MIFLKNSRAFLILAVLAFAGCKRGEIRVYLAPKDAPPTAAASAPADDHAHDAPAPRPRPALTWTLPAGWTEGAANEMSLANFKIKTDAGEATVNITPLPGLEGREADIVNMWREQVGQPPLAEADLGATLTPVEVAGGKGQESPQAAFPVCFDRANPSPKRTSAAAGAIVFNKVI